MPEIEGGYYIKARKIQESEIAFAPPHVREIWDWLIKEANHKDNGKFKRGQTMRSYNDIRNGLKWHVGFRTERYSKNHCETAMRWLTKRGMIHTAKTTRGMIITIVNYDIYQNPMNYGKYNETYNKHTTNIQSVDTINNNDNNDKNDKKGLHLFSNSEYYDIAKFKDKFYSNPNYQKYDYSYYYEAVKNWADSKGAMKKDWIATARNFALNDENPKLIKPNVFRLPEH